MRRVSAFSLVEILVVLAVLAILAAFLAPVIRSAHATAIATKCLNNSRQIGVAWQMLLTDSPLTGAPGMEGQSVPKVQYADGAMWVDKLDSYLKGDKNVLTCDLQKDSTSFAYGMNPTSGASWWSAQGFFGGGFLLTPDEKRPRSVALIKNPSETLVFCESGKVSSATKALPSNLWEEESAPWKPYVAFSIKSGGYNWGNTVPMTGIGAMGWDENYRALGRHEGKSATAFVDGHVDLLEIQKLTDPTLGASDCLFDNE